MPTRVRAERALLDELRELLELAEERADHVTLRWRWARWSVVGVRAHLGARREAIGPTTGTMICRPGP